LKSDVLEKFLFEVWCI